MIKQISQKAKFKFAKWCLQRDGETCIYCGKSLDSRKVLEHLNNDRNDNRLENFVNAHQACNIAKAFNMDYQILAQEKLKQNESALFIPLEDHTDDQASTEIKISKNNFDITEQYILEKITLDGKINKDEAINSSVFRCKKLTGYGSIQCIQNYIKILTCAEGPFMEALDDNKKKIIVKRTGN